ncbi:uncharacterized protein [Physcomitrium patens]|uniref:Uncharacterized protein n=1 Tax=Physcomitrium patens TaxID=3218 RepID=A9SVG7_PHYPA|nr:uncharacterized protein LOC112292516 [Physcomitrium patens]XP_024396847.1 uncharacterized protein LOC112292516 [Physcomitrium patens]XP_024396848.1 uncharacterized protein LOC112292516 [Physcomitrium patens]XP_024396849.1 uncharacterized protein LOC112292516 [Physcomitrium patens]XP_024396850.1 uncharacterized protein LOC112292516 [Physcomitrium patens]PNR38936.1 hypothetical protein PHYPA_019214 [Physcomitrium patens]|eukprot:XP_024396846.1 uncharacterized protein LOC112292516 [Physcomitrella patens]
MAQHVGAFWCQSSQLCFQLSRSKAKVFSSSAISPFLPRTAWEDMLVPRLSTEWTTDTLTMATTYPVVCFRDDDAPLPEYLVERNWSDMNVRTNLEIRYSPWAVEMMNGFGNKNEAKTKESTGGPPGNGNGGDDGGNGGGGGGDDDGDYHVFLLPMLTLAFAAFHLGYCIAVWVKDDNLDFEFLRTGLGLFGLLAVSAFRLNTRTGIDAYILGLGASLGVMVWTGERCLVKKEGNPAGVVALFAASMAVMLTAALYHTF